jgi:hypothetical protein
MPRSFAFRPLQDERRAVVAGHDVVVEGVMVVLYVLRGIEELDMKAVDQLSVPGDADVVPRHVRALRTGCGLRSGAPLAVLYPGGRGQFPSRTDGDREMLEEDVC